MAEPEDPRAGGQVLIDLLIRILLLLPIPLMLGTYALYIFIFLGIYLMFFAKRSLQGILLIIAALVMYFLFPQINNIPATIYALAQIISVQLLPLSAFPAIEAAATWVLWIFIALIFAGTEDWKQMLMYLAIGGIAMTFIGSLGIFAVADAELTASLTPLMQDSEMKNQTGDAISNVWLMISNPRQWYENNYGYKNDTLAQGVQMSPLALEITKAEVIEKLAPPGGKITLDFQVRNQGKQDALLKRIDAQVETANLGAYDRWTKEFATNPDNKGKGYLYFESTPTAEAHYTFCDNPRFDGGAGDPIQEGFTKVEGTDLSATRGFFVYGDETKPGQTFEPGVIDEYFAEIRSPLCYGTQRVNSTILYTYNVTSTYNLELIGSDYFTELAKYNKLQFHVENSRSTEGPLKLTIRSVPESQPVRLRNGESNEVQVFYSLSDVGPGTLIVQGEYDMADTYKNIYLEEIDPDLQIVDGKCDFKDNGLTGDKRRAYVTVAAAQNFFTKDCSKVYNNIKDFGIAEKCLTIGPGNPTNIVLLKCTFKYTKPETIEKTKTLFMKMHVTYDYRTTRKAQYDIIPMPDSHACFTKRALDGFPNKTMMDYYIKDVFKNVPAASLPADYTSKWNPSSGFTSPADFCVRQTA